MIALFYAKAANNNMSRFTMTLKIDSYKSVRRS